VAIWRRRASAWEEGNGQSAVGNGEEEEEEEEEEDTPSVCCADTSPGSPGEAEDGEAEDGEGEEGAGVGLDWG
jgi:hypothetical protein